MANTANSTNRFDDFFNDPLYLELKNHLFNYRIRKKKIRSFLKKTPEGVALEIGSGVSPISPCGPRVIYTDLSAQAAAQLKRHLDGPSVLVMSATQVCLKSETVSAVVCSEVLEHVPDDAQVLREIRRILKPGGALILTVPTHDYLFSSDDRYVKHCRRYDPARLMAQLNDLGFDRIQTVKIAGILDKVAMMSAVTVFKICSSFRSFEKKKTWFSRGAKAAFVVIYRFVNWLFGLSVQLEAFVIPRSMATIMLFHCRKRAC